MGSIFTAAATLATWGALGLACGACNKGRPSAAVPPSDPGPMHAQSATVFIPNDPNKAPVPISTVTDATSGKSVVVAHSLPRDRNADQGDDQEDSSQQDGSLPTQKELIEASEAMEPLLQEAEAAEALEAIRVAEEAGQTPQAQFERAERRGRIHIPGNVVFETGAATLADDRGTETVLEEVLEFLEEHPKVTLFRIEGHTDSVGTKFNNLILSGQRALTIKEWLIDHGIDHERLLAVGFGDTDPIADNAYAAGRAQNRRVEFYVAAWQDTLLEKNPAGGGRIFGL
jgi:outer membrane protein OmpA-like peptidoglycan-associated protein